MFGQPEKYTLSVGEAPKPHYIVLHLCARALDSGVSIVSIVLMQLYPTLTYSLEVKNVIRALGVHFSQAQSTS